MTVRFEDVKELAEFISTTVTENLVSSSRKFNGAQRSTV